MIEITEALLKEGLPIISKVSERHTNATVLHVDSTYIAIYSDYGNVLTFSDLETLSLCYGTYEDYAWGYPIQSVKERLQEHIEKLQDIQRGEWGD